MQTTYNRTLQGHGAITASVVVEYVMYSSICLEMVAMSLNMNVIVIDNKGPPSIVLLNSATRKAISIN